MNKKGLGLVSQRIFSLRRSLSDIPHSAAVATPVSLSQLKAIEIYEFLAVGTGIGV